jgi:hypothetical protein
MGCGGDMPPRIRLQTTARRSYLQFITGSIPNVRPSDHLAPSFAIQVVLHRSSS